MDSDAPDERERPGLGWRPEPCDLRRMLREHAGLDYGTLTAVDGGESRSVFRATDRAGVVSFVKILPDADADTPDRVRALTTMVTQLRDRGYPAPRTSAAGHLPGLNYWITERIPGYPLDPGSGIPDLKAIARFLPELIRLNDFQADLGTGDVREWRVKSVRECFGDGRSVRGAGSRHGHDNDHETG